MSDNDGGPPPTRATVRVRGEGIVEAVPDAATIVAAVHVTRTSLPQARDEAAGVAAAIVAAAREMGVAKRDIQTGRYTVSPQRRVESKGKPAAIVGYDVRNSITVTTRKLERVSELLDALTAAGANQVDGPAFFLQHPEEAEDEARRRAMASATRRAGVLAAAAGTALGRVRTIVDTESRGGPMPKMMRAFAAESAAPTPIEAGTERVLAVVEVEWELG